MQNSLGYTPSNEKLEAVSFRSQVVAGIFV
jgi:hypothetical protein